MSHQIIIFENGTGEGGTVESKVTWTPSHGLTPQEEARRRGRVENHLRKIGEILYGDAYEHDHGE